MAGGLKEVLASDELTDAAVLRVSQDYVREVVAHEVGHVLGLRHNFAGSLAGTLPQKELDDWFRAYISRQAPGRLHQQNPVRFRHGLQRSQSRRFHRLAHARRSRRRCRTTARPSAGVILTARKRAPKNALRHRRGNLAVTAMSVGSITATNRWSAPIREIAEIIDLLPNNVIETFIRARAPRNPHDRIPLEQVNLSYALYAMQLSGAFGDILSWFKAETRSLACRE